MTAKPWQDRDLMYELYVERGMSAREINEHFGEPVHRRTISSWLNRLDIPARDRSEAGILAKLKTRIPCFYTDDLGYERWETRHRNEKFVLRVHRLLAVAEYGFDAVAGNVVHHKNGLKWDNRPENIEVMPEEEHMRHHAIEREFGGLHDGKSGWEIHHEKQAAAEDVNDTDRTLVADVGREDG